PLLRDQIEQSRYRDQVGSARERSLEMAAEVELDSIQRHPLVTVLVAGKREQGGIVVDQIPVLLDGKVRAECADGRAGTTGEVDSMHGGSGLERIGDRLKDHRIPRGPVIGLPQRQPIGSEPAHVSLCSALAKIV